MPHKATIVPGSVKELGANGIAFSIMCCGNDDTRERHTICHAHTMTTEELEAMIENKYLRRIAKDHAAAKANAKHIEKMAAKIAMDPDVTECEGCK